MNENPFWLALWELANTELRRHDTTSADFIAELSQALETIAARIIPDGEFYKVAGIENPPPQPATPVLNMFIVGCLLGNLLAWKNGVNFFQRTAKSN